MGEPASNLERAVLAALDRGEPLDADALLFLLRRAQASARDDMADGVGLAIARALPDVERASTAPARAAWVVLLVEIRQCSDDSRIDEAIERLLPGLREDWTAPRVADAAVAIEAALHAASLSGHRLLAAAAVDALERLVGAHYRPGRAMGAFADQVRAASALLTAYGLSGRLPYSMLAEELMQSARRLPPSDFSAACGAARVLCRLAVLHADPEYRAAAVLAPRADYRGDAAQLLANVSAEADARGAAAGIYGVALLELESASSLP